MATILRSYDWSKGSKTNKRARGRNYPWDDWFDGRIWELEPGTDFDGPATGLERVIRTSANRRGIKVRIRIDEGNVVVQRHEDGDLLRTITKSPSLKSIKAKQEANGHKPEKVVTKAIKRTATKAAPAPTARKRTLKRVPA